MGFPFNITFLSNIMLKSKWSCGVILVRININARSKMVTYLICVADPIYLDNDLQISNDNRSRCITKHLRDGSTSM